MVKSARELAAAAQAALARGDNDAAQHICAAWSAEFPGDPNARLLGGIAAYRRVDYAAAVVQLERACELAPAAAQAWLWLGNAQRQLAQLEPATLAYQQALAIAPALVDAAYNLAWVSKELGDDVRAGAAFTHWGRLQSTDEMACQQAVNAAARLARNGQSAPAASTTPIAAPLPLVSFIVCSITPAKLAAVQSNLTERMAGHAWEMVAITDARSLCEAYTRGAQRARGEVLVFCHDDIEFLDEDFPARLAGALDGADVIGVFGTTQVNGPAVAWAGLPHVHGWITHMDEQGLLLPSISSFAPARVDGVQAIDGVFMAMHRRVLDHVAFDAQRFDGFHFYDLDFSYRAHLAGLRLRIQCDLLLTHASTGKFNEAYSHYAQRFCEKFPHFADARPPQSATFFQAQAGSHDEVRRFYGWIAHWLRNCPMEASVAR